MGNILGMAQTKADAATMHCQRRTSLHKGAATAASALTARGGAEYWANWGGMSNQPWSYFLFFHALFFFGVLFFLIGQGWKIRLPKKSEQTLEHIGSLPLSESCIPPKKATYMGEIVSVARESNGDSAHEFVYLVPLFFP